MSTTKLFGVLAVLIIVFAGLWFFMQSTHSSQSSTANTQEAAIDAVIAVHPELASYKTTSLPPSSIEAVQAADGWNVGFIQRGSGLPGILNAKCFHVDAAHTVTATGEFTRSDTVTEYINLATCTGTDSVSASPSPTSPSPTTSSYGNVSLKLNQSATFPDITLKPVSIEEDSRCPEDVQCIQAGTVRVKIEVKGKSGTNPSIVKLGQAFPTEGVSITLTDVKPVKNSKVQASPTDYLFTFKVVKQGTPVTSDPKAKCHVGGCSQQLCTDQPDMVSTCEYTAAYACYKTATCERQPSGECGWTPTAELTACLKNAQ